MGAGLSFARRYDRASAPVRRLIDELLDDDATDRAWAEHVGPAFSQPSVAELLGKSKQAVSADRRLLRLRTRNGRAVYPAFQFEGRRQVPGLDVVVPMLLEAAATPWTAASWLVSPLRKLGRRRPIDAMRHGDVERVIAAAKAFARDLRDDATS